MENTSNLNDETKNEIIAQFLSTVENTDAVTATKFLELSGWDIGIAIETYYDELESKHQISEPNLNEGQGSSKDEERAVENPSGNPKTNNKFRTLNDIKNSDESEDKEGQDLFAGGHKSGTAIRYPGQSDNVNSLLNGLFNKINQPMSDDEEEEPNQPVSSSAFRGIGSRLGDVSDVNQVPDQNVDIPGSFPSQINPSDISNETVVKKVTLWKNGISIEDGPLISYDAPEAQAFLRGANEGRAPISLLGVQPGQKVNVHVHKKMDEEYKPLPVSVKPFQGSGNRLGSIVPSTSSSTSNPISNPSQPHAPVQTYTLNPDLPQTSIQIRLSDGSRLIAKFNHNHTLSDVYNHVQASTNSTQPFILQTTFPIKKLENDSITLSEASLLNSAIVQRFV